MEAAVTAQVKLKVQNLSSFGRFINMLGDHVTNKIPTICLGFVVCDADKKSLTSKDAEYNRDIF